MNKERRKMMILNKMSNRISNDTSDGILNENSAEGNIGVNGTPGENYRAWQRMLQEEEERKHQEEAENRKPEEESEIPEDEGKEVPTTRRLSDMEEQQLADLVRMDVPKLSKDIPLKKLSRSPLNHFKELKGELYAELKASIENNGLVNPIIVRPRSYIEDMIDGMIEGDYEILAGHNRFKVFEELGKETIPCFVVEADDVKAAQIIHDSNLQRENVTELEKAWSYRVMLEAMDRSGSNQYVTRQGHSTFIHHSKLVDNLSTSSSEINENNRKSRDIIGDMYGISGKSVERKVRLTYLTGKFYNRLTRREISQETAINLSYLEEDLQRRILQDEEDSPIHYTNDNTGILKREFLEWRKENPGRRSTTFPRNRYLEILSRKEYPEEMNTGSETETEKALKRNKKYAVPDDLFPETIKKGDREDYIVKALKYILENQIEL